MDVGEQAEGDRGRGDQATGLKSNTSLLLFKIITPPIALFAALRRRPLISNAKSAPTFHAEGEKSPLGRGRHHGDGAQPVHTGQFIRVCQG